MDKALQTMIDNMPEKTGKSLDQWRQILQQKAFAKHSEALNFLKNEYSVSHGFANTIVHLSKEITSSTDDLLKEQYAGKETLFPIYERLIKVINEFGDDITITPKKGSVSLIRKRQFALIKPSTKKRIDLGLKLKDVVNQGKLEGSGPFGTMCTHRIQLFSLENIDDEVQEWLQVAYQKSI